MRAVAHPFLWLLAGLLAMTVPVNAQTISFDELLDGFEQQCNTSENYNRMHESLIERVYGNGKTWLPTNLRPAFGAARINRKSGFSDVEIPLSNATWRGLRLSSLVFFIGDSNGINSKAIVFAASASEVRRVFGASVNASARAMKNDPNNMTESSISFGTTNGKPSIVCDLST